MAARLRITFSRTASGFAFVPEGFYPRRVAQGEVLARAEKFPLLAPRSGPVELDEAGECFDLRVEGALRIGPGGERVTLQRLGDVKLESFIHELREAGIPALDFPGRPLFQLFESAAANGPVTVLLSTRDSESALAWEKFLGDGLAETTNFLKNLLGHSGTNSVITYRGAGSFAREGLERYGRFLPAVIARRVLPQKKLHNDLPLEKQGVVFLGPATIYALQNWLLHDRPFFSRPVAVRLDSSSVFARPRRSRVHELPNGYPLEELFRVLKRSAAARVIAGDYVRNREQVQALDAIGHLNLFQHSAFYVSRRHRLRYDLNLSCTGCMACERICPVSAQPLALLDGREHLFRERDCLDCGLCTYICDSAIPLAAAIQELRDGNTPTN